EEIARQWDEEERQRAIAEAKSTKQIDWNDPSGNYKLRDFKFMPMDLEHGTEKKKSPEKMKSTEKVEEEDVAT
ncbi:hypothetical protein Tco_0372112, partial [Tanacetum coccineum]